MMQCKKYPFSFQYPFQIIFPLFMKSVNNVQLRSVHFMPHSHIAKTGFPAKHASTLHMEPSIYINLNLFYCSQATKSQFAVDFVSCTIPTPPKLRYPSRAVKTDSIFAFFQFSPCGRLFVFIPKNRIILRQRNCEKGTVSCLWLLL